jgi:regulator of replication initiation timing
MSDFDYQQWRTSSAVTPEMLDSCLERLAAVDAENKRLQLENQHLADLAQNRNLAWKQAEAELAALKARRCETCAGGDQVDGILDLTLCQACKRFSTTNSLVVPNSHACSWWAERQTE